MPGTTISNNAPFCFLASASLARLSVTHWAEGFAERPSTESSAASPIVATSVSAAERGRASDRISRYRMTGSSST